MDADDALNAEQLVASIARFLIDGGENEAALVIAGCTMRAVPSSDPWISNGMSGAEVSVSGPRAAYDILSDEAHPIRKSFMRALEGVLCPDYYVYSVTVAVGRVHPEPGWKNDIAAIARGDHFTNQARDHHSRPPHHWNNLGFRSKTEVVIAEALDANGVLFFPLPSARLALEGEQRGTLVPDFLVCANGKWGILEVDGEPFHPPGTAAKDHRRDRYFQLQGVKVVQHFDANECFRAPAEVVRRFLALLQKNG